MGLVNLGVEEGKGTTVTKAAFKPWHPRHINFIGNVLKPGEVPARPATSSSATALWETIILNPGGRARREHLKLLKKNSWTDSKPRSGAVHKDSWRAKNEFDYSNGGAPILGVRRAG